MISTILRDEEEHLMLKYTISSNITDELIPELADEINQAGEKVKILV